jgi:NAD-dependent dihydropyrimidine dehydrogenase PreA subunit
MKRRAETCGNPPTVGDPIRVDAAVCEACNVCVSVCRCGVLVPNTQEGPPVVLYPDECWFCGCCVEHCPVPEAIAMAHPLNMRVGWRDALTGELRRIRVPASRPNRDSEAEGDRRRP